MTAPKQNELDWNVDEHGRMREYATGPDDEPETVPYKPQED